MIGDGPETENLCRLAQELNLQDHVYFTGAIAHRDIPSYVSLLDIAVQPAANEYCCPMKILEYLALGKPLIGPRQENIQELVREGVDAMLVVVEPGARSARTAASIRACR